MVSFKRLLLSAAGLLLFQLATYAQKTPPLSVKIDPRSEAISIFYYLAITDTVDVKPTPSIYYRAVKEHFKDFSTHPSIQWYRDLETWDGYDMPSLGVFLSNAAPFKVQGPLERPFVRSAPQEEFLGKLNQFSVDYKTSTFLKRQERLFSKVTGSVKDSIVKSNLLVHLQNFYGSKHIEDFIVYLDLLNNHGNNAIVNTSSPFKNKIQIRLAYLNPDTAQSTDASPISFKLHENVLIHEASHVYVNDFVDKYAARLEQIKDLFLTTSKGKKLKESEWKNELDELLVRTCVAKILGNKFGAEKGQLEIDNQARHFKLARGLYIFMDGYIQNREKYPSIQDYYPEIIAYLEALPSEASK